MARLIKTANDVMLRHNSRTIEVEPVWMIFYFVLFVIILNKWYGKTKT